MATAENVAGSIRRLEIDEDKTLKLTLAFLAALLVARLVSLHADEPALVQHARESLSKASGHGAAEHGAAEHGAAEHGAAELNAALVQRIMIAADKNRDGKLSLEEYKALDVQTRHHGEEHFEAGEVSGDGFLDLDELNTHAEAKLKMLEDGRRRKTPRSSP